MHATDLALVQLAARLAVHLGVVEPGAATRALDEEAGGRTPARLFEALGLDRPSRRALEIELGRRLEAAGGDAARALAEGPAVPVPAERAFGRTPALARAEATARGRPYPNLRRPAPGRYVDFLPVGDGGMGIVYRATDVELGRRVAFKVVRPPPAAEDPYVTPSVPLALERPPSGDRATTDFEGLVARFLQEAWVTSGLEHPGIVPLYELGETEGGVPYYTMRYVEGERSLRDAIDALADGGVETRLEQLLEPFLKMCDTVRFAHSRGVIHRDLKPDHVALGAYGEVVVLDWGLAAIRGDPPAFARVRALREERGLHTRATIVGTPGYLAPEAAAGEAGTIDARGDVYALGVILFEILTGRRPFAFRDAEDYVAQVLAEDAPDPRTFTPAAPAPLARLAVEALARDPAGRPESADRFAARVRLWRDDAARDREVAVRLAEARRALEDARSRSGLGRLEAVDRAMAACGQVEALRPGSAEARDVARSGADLRALALRERERQARRVTLRRAVGVALFGLLLVGVAAAWLLEIRRREAETARRMAVADRARAEDVMGFMVFELQESLEPLGRLDVLARLGATARRYYASLPLESLGPESLRGHTVALRHLGEVCEARGDLPAALDAFGLAEDAAVRGEALRPDDVALRLDGTLARLATARARLRQGYVAQARQDFEREVRDLESQAAARPADEACLLALAEAHGALGLARAGDGDLAGALDALTRADLLATDLANREPADGRGARCKTRGRLELARVLALARCPERAAPIAADALATCRTWLGPERGPEDVRWRRLEADALLVVGGVHDAPGAPAEAATEAAVAAYDRLLAADPDDATCRHALARALTQRGDLAAARGDRLAAFASTRRAFAMARDLVAKDPTNATWLHLLVTQCDRVAHQGLAAGLLPEEGLAHRRLADETAARLVALDPSNRRWRHVRAYTRVWLARTLPEAEAAARVAHLEAALETVDALYAEMPDSEELAVLGADAREAWARAVAADGRREEALRALDAAVLRLERTIGLRPEVGALLEVRLRVEEARLRLRLGGAAEERAEGIRSLRAAVEDVSARLEAMEGGEGARARSAREHLQRVRSRLDTLDAPESAMSDAHD